MNRRIDREFHNRSTRDFEREERKIEDVEFGLRSNDYPMDRSTNFYKQYSNNRAVHSLEKSLKIFFKIKIQSLPSEVLRNVGEIFSFMIERFSQLSCI